MATAGALAGAGYTAEQVGACIICLDNEGHPLPIQCGCGCRDEAGCAHVARKAAYAAHQGPGCHNCWNVCPTCKQHYTGAMLAGPGGSPVCAAKRYELCGCSV